VKGLLANSFLTSANKLEAFWRDKGLNSSQALKCSRILSILENPGLNPLLYEGWNFNSGNYLFTTDTK